MSHPERQQITLEYHSPPSADGIRMVLSSPSAPQGDSEGLQSSNTYRKRNQLYAMQESLVIPSGMTLRDKLTTYSELTLNLNLFERLDQGSTLGGGSLSPYWSEYTRAISDALCVPTQIDSSGLGSPSLSGYASKQAASSWFSMNVTSLQSKNSYKISCPSSTASLLGYTGSGSTSNKSRKSYKSKPRNQTQKVAPNSIRKIRLYPCKELHSIWKRWLAGYRWIYNWTINYLCNNPLTSAYTLQPLARSTPKPEWVSSLPGHQLQEAVADAVDSYKQAIANKGQAKFKSCRARSQVIKFKVGNYKHGCWYPRLTGRLGIVISQPIPSDCIYGTQLIYQDGEWYGCFPEVKVEPQQELTKVIALDPGNRTFLTGYDGDTIFEVGQNDIGRVNRLCTHLDNLASLITKSTVKRQRYRMRKAAGRIRKRIRNLVKDLHHKAANFLTKHYKVIFLPTFKVSQMVLKKKRRIRSKTARNMLTLSHYSFAQHLIQMARRRGNIVVRCNESYTSKTCPQCGHIHNRLGGSKQFHCPQCGYTAPRDSNGARSIMVRALSATTFLIRQDEILLLGLESNN